MQTFIILSLALAAFAAPQAPGGGAAGGAPGGAAGGAAIECLSKCATEAFGVDATSLTAANIPCAKEYAGPDGLKGAAFKTCICKDAKVSAAMTCQGKCQYGSMITGGFKSFCK
ncbi:hypothetical protein BLS_006069 [Venturia inaequalis]|uniref:Uncharacterized protein n=1 Tax=Venturia inaequalis TaxID=5025 RepID=A0A8H3Z5S1_VENIN|nr:hypothetical protein BLS_006069 [Venturia inaequalis]KAE9984158.1 hypothetical protein EG328_009037 [Venturia inaequalis]KAE9994127.1 hypothetical protein EG327_001199 [Venturia inaequalis]RDI82479.1 hypothetical protein Vi05172_g7376 [Venturia inaequalis]